MRRENKFISQTVRLVHIQGGLSLIPFFLSRPFPLYISFGNVGGVVAHQHINSNRLICYCGGIGRHLRLGLRKFENFLN